MKNEPKRPDMRKILNPALAALLFVFFFAFYFHNLFYFAPLVFERDDVIYGADTGESVAAVKDFLSFAYMHQRHLLFPYVTGPLMHLIRFLFSISEDNAVVTVLALFAAVDIVVAYYVLILFTKKKALALLFTIFYGFSFSNLIFFSVPETYVLANLAILVYFYCLIKFNEDLTLWRVVVLSLLTGSAALINAPLILLVIPSSYAISKAFELKRSAKMLLINALVASSIFVVTFLMVNGMNSNGYFFREASVYASLDHYRSSYAMANTLGNFLLFSITSPFDMISISETTRSTDFVTDFPGYFSSAARIFLIWFYVTSISVFGVYVIANRNTVTDSLSLWLLAMLFFYIFYSPGEAIIYSSQAVIPLTLLLANGFDKIESNKKYAFLTVFLGVMIVNNVHAMNLG